MDRLTRKDPPKIVDGVLIVASPHIHLRIKLAASTVVNLGILEHVEGLDLRFTNIRDLGKLRSVDRGLDLRDTKLKTLGKIEHVGGYLFLPDGEYIKDFESYKLEGDRFIAGLDVLDYPLHMKHENWVVRTEVDKFLEGSYGL